MAGDDWSPLDEGESAVQIEALLDLCAARGWTRIVDIGCGDGRVAVPLAEAGVRVLALDTDLEAIHAVGAHGLAHIEARRADALDPACPFVFSDGSRAQAAVVLGHTLMEFHDVGRAADLFARLRAALEPDGAIVVDNAPRDVWRDVAEGAWQEGVSEDGAWQMVWAEGDALVAMRRGSEVDDEDWQVREGDRLLRLWSLGALRLLALASGWAEPREDRSGALLVFGTT